MRRIVGLAVVMVVLVWGQVVQAAPILGFNFEIGADSGAGVGTLSGMVVGEDLDGSNTFSFNELSMVMLNWSGTPNVPAFSHDLSNVISDPVGVNFDFFFNHTTGFGSLLSCTVSAATDCNFGASQERIVSDNTSPFIFIYSADGSAVAQAVKPVVVTPKSSEPVPEPATLFLFGSGLLGLVGYTRRTHSSSRRA